MAYDDRLWLTFNGEIHNYLNYGELKAVCHRFRTGSDTEVILAPIASGG